MRKKRDTDEIIKSILLKLHNSGGCDAEKNTFSEGWDKAINLAISIVENESNVCVETVLD